MISVSEEELNGVIKYFQDNTGIRTYSTQRKQGIEKPYFYFEIPRTKSEKVAGNITIRRVALYGVLHSDSEEELQKVLPSIEHRLIANDYVIKCVNENFEDIDSYIEEVELTYRKVDTDIIAFELKGERFVSITLEEADSLKNANLSNILGGGNDG